MTLDFVAPLHVLLVEQDEEIRALFTTLLTAYGAKVSVASDAHAALAIATSNPPQAVFSSIVFHDMDGFELCRRLRARTETCESLIVALTGYSENKIEEKIRAAGFDRYLLKPVSIHVVISLLETIAQRRLAHVPTV